MPPPARLGACCGAGAARRLTARFLADLEKDPDVAVWMALEKAGVGGEGIEGWSMARVEGTTFCDVQAAALRRRGAREERGGG